VRIRRLNGEKHLGVNSSTVSAFTRSGERETNRSSTLAPVNRRSDGDVNDVKHPWVRLRAWPLWSAPRAFISYLVAVAVLFVALAVVLLAGTVPSPSDLAGAAVLLACAAVCVEATRRLEQTAGLGRDLQSAWGLPIALLLPPVYGLLAPVPLKVVSQLRHGRSQLHRRVLSAVTIGLAQCAASELFHRLLPPGEVRAALLANPARTVLAALGSAALCYLVNTVLITTAVRLSSAEVSWRQMLLDRESLFIDLVEVCMSIAVFTAWSVSPGVVLVLLPPAVLLQRSLTYAQMRTAARTDAKTGLLNAAAWHQEADREIVRATRDRRPLAVLMIDLDNFKAFNDTHGHLAGDQALAAVASSLVGGLRIYDQLGRFGGEEFAVVLPSADQNEARRVAERLRRAVAELLIPGVAPVARLTVSIGAAIVGTHGAGLIDLLTAADLALYQAKAGGRNQVAFAPGLPPHPPDAASTRRPAGARRR